MDLNSLTAFFDTYKLAIISFVVMVLLAFVLIRLTLSLRASAEKELAQLQYTNPPYTPSGCQKTAADQGFPKNEILLMHLEAR
jgi:hypothetical protein